MLDHIKKIANNDFLLSISMAVVSIVILFIYNKTQNKHYDYVEYPKICVIVALCIYGSLFLKDKFKGIPSATKDSINSNINIGEPDF